MYQPALYHQSHKSAKEKAGNLIQEYFPKLQWRQDGEDTLLDVGSGPGDVLMDYIYPLMPSNFGKIVCSDVCPEMVDFAKSYYSSKQKCEYCTLDISTTEELSPDLIGKFDHITSVFCLHWVQDYRTALRNINDLIRPEGGDCLLMFMSSHTLFDAYIYASKHTKWSEYMKDIYKYMSPLQNSIDAKAEFTALMEEAGFDNVSIEIKTNVEDYGSVKNFKENIKSICGILGSIPLSMHSEFMDDFVAIMSKCMPQQNEANEINLNASMQYDLMVVYGKKRI